MAKRIIDLIHKLSANSKTIILQRVKVGDKYESVSLEDVSDDDAAAFITKRILDLLEPRPAAQPKKGE